MPLPVGVSVAISSRSNCPASRASRSTSKAVRRLPAVQICSAIELWWTSLGKSSSGIAIGPPLTWNDTSGRHASR